VLQAKAEVALEIKANAKRELKATVASPPFACALLQAKAEVAFELA
jgi:hypothetical protein